MQSGRDNSSWVLQSLFNDHQPVSARVTSTAQLQCLMLMLHNTFVPHHYIYRSFNSTVILNIDSSCCHNVPRAAL